RLEDARGEVLVGVAVGEDEAADPGGAAGDRHLAHGPARVVADQGDVVEIERLEEAFDDRRDAGRGEVGVGGHRNLLGAHRPVGGDAVEAIGKSVDDAVPEAAVDQVAVDEDDGRPGSRLPITDDPLWKPNLFVFTNHAINVHTP